MKYLTSVGVNRRFHQWILDTCLRPYDQNLLSYQRETVRRHAFVWQSKLAVADQQGLW